jgi:hypothetical protein
MGRGENEGVYILAEVDCEAILDPSLGLTSEELKKRLKSGDRPGNHPSASSVDVMLPEQEGEGKEPPQKSAG